MNAYTILRAIGISLTTALLLSACNKHSVGSDNSILDDGDQNFLHAGFNINYLTRNSWYGVASNEEFTACLSKLSFSSNNVVNSTFYANDDGVTLESEDLLFSVENDSSLILDDHDIFNYQSHTLDLFITDEARFFKNHSDAMSFANESQIDCSVSLPE